MKNKLAPKQRSEKPALSYRYEDGLYLNITSHCPTACAFCIKFTWDYFYRGNDLLLKKEPTVQEILDSVDDPALYKEIVFCGYGESSYRLKEMEEIAQKLKSCGAKKFRLNTIGLGNLIHGRNIAPDLAKFLDVVSISLNTTDPKKWAEIHRPLPQFKEKGFESVLEFIRECAKVIPQTFVTAVELPESENKDFEKFAKGLGAQVRFRLYLDNYENK